MKTTYNFLTRTIVSKPVASYHKLAGRYLMSWNCFYSGTQYTCVCVCVVCVCVCVCVRACVVCAHVHVRVCICLCAIMNHGWHYGTMITYALINAEVLLSNLIFRLLKWGGTGYHHRIDIAYTFPVECSLLFQTQKIYLPA